MIFKYDENALLKIIGNVNKFIKAPITVYNDRGERLDRCYTGGVTDYCRLVRKVGANDKQCIAQDRGACMRCRVCERALSYKCHAGLYETVVPIIQKGVYLGYLIFGQYRMAEECIDLAYRAKKLGVDEEALSHAYGSVSILTAEEVSAAADLLKACIEYIFTLDIIYTPSYERAEQIRAYIDSHLGAQLSIDLLCREFFMSRRHLQKIFTDAFGITVKQYVLKNQLKYAEHFLITTDIPITRVAELAGFGDYNNFIQRFKKTHGLTPLAYRKANSRIAKEK